MTMSDWPRQMGELRGRRDQAASLEAQRLAHREDERHHASLQRWPAIVAEMRTLIAHYNEGAGLDALTLVEDSVNPGVTLESASNGGQALVIALDGAEVSVRTCNGHAGSINGAHWVSLDRTNENAAAYLLRDWMERL